MFRLVMALVPLKAVVVPAAVVKAPAVAAVFWVQPPPVTKREPLEPLKVLLLVSVQLLPMFTPADAVKAILPIVTVGTEV